MNNQIVTYKTAKLAKEKGFNYPVFRAYQGNNPKDADIQYDGDYDDAWVDVQDWNNYFEGYISAPTQEELASWLRDEHNIVVETNVYHKNISENHQTVKAVGYSSIVDIVKFNEIIHTDEMLENMHVVPDGVFEKYEDARESGIRYALNLIK